MSANSEVFSVEVSSVFIDFIIILLQTLSLLHVLKRIKLVLCSQRPFFMRVLTL
jgi:hypothetical protein